MSAIAEKTVRELALESSSATRVFEKLGIDYCCGGDKSLEEACRAANLTFEQVQSSLDAAQQESNTATVRDWQKEPLADLIAHINATHHKYVRQEIARLGPLFEKVCGVHGKTHPEVALKVLKVVGARLRRLVGIIEELSFTTVRHRLSAYLLRLAQDHGKKVAQGVEVILPSNNQELAAQIGTVRELVSRNLSRLQMEGVLTVDGRCLIIRDLKALESDLGSSG